MQVITQREARLLKALGQTLFPRSGAMAADGVDADVAGYIDGYMAKLAVWDQLRLRSLYQLFEFGITVTSRNPAKRFTTASADERVEYLRMWEHSSNYHVRMVFGAMRSVFLLAYLGNDTVSGEFGLDLKADPSIEGHLEELSRLAKRVKPGTVAQPLYTQDRDSLVPDAPSTVADGDDAPTE